MMNSKIHRATVTGADLHYVGSVSIDRELMVLADIREFEQVSVVNIENGARFESYAIPGAEHEICLNGAAARLGAPGDRVIIITYADFDDVELANYSPHIVHVDTGNNFVPEEFVPTGRRYTEFPEPTSS